MKIKSLTPQRLAEWGAILILLLLASYLRMGDSGIVEYKRDEANLSRLALDVANGEDFPLLGIGSSVGFPNAPVNVYVLAMPYVLSSSPEFATQFIGFLNVIAVLLVYLLIRRYTNPFVALAMLAVYAVSPWALIFSRKIWAQNMLPVFVMATIGTGIVGFVDGKRWGQWLCLPLLVITGQIHYVAFVIIPAIVYLLWQGRKRFTRAFFISIIIAIAVTTPFIIGLERADLLSPSALRDALDSGDTEFEPDDDEFVSFEAIRSSAVLIAGTELHSLAGSERFTDYLDDVPDVYPLWGVLAWATLFAVIWLVIRSIQFADKRTPVDITLLIALCFPIIAFSFNWTAFFIHYLIPIMPIAIVILGLGIYDGYRYLANYKVVRKSAFGVGVIVGIVILVTQLWLWRDLLDFIDDNATPNGFGTPYHYLAEPRDAILVDNPQQVIGQFEGQFIGIDGEVTVWDTLLYDVPIVRFEDPQTRVYPAIPATIITNHCDSTTTENQFYLREDEGCYSLGSRQQSDLDLTEFDAIEVDSSQFANGANVTHYAWDETNQCLSLVWEIHQTATQDYMFAVHFFNESDERIAQADGLSWAGAYWLPNDIVVRIFCVPEVNPDIVSVGIGMYTFDGTNFYGVDLIDSNNVPMGQMFNLPLE